MTTAEIIANEIKKLEKQNNWTELTELDFKNLPVARIRFGRIHSNGIHERFQGTITIWKDGTVTRHYNL